MLRAVPVHPVAALALIDRSSQSSLIPSCSRSVAGGGGGGGGKLTCSSSTPTSLLECGVKFKRSCQFNNSTKSRIWLICAVSQYVSPIFSEKSNSLRIHLSYLIRCLKTTEKFGLINKNNVRYDTPRKCKYNVVTKKPRDALARAVVKAPKSTHITPILKSLHWLKVNERIEYKLLSLTYKVLTTWYPFNPVPELAPHLLLPFLAQKPSPHWKSQIVHSVMHHLVFGINFQIHSVSLISPVSIHLLIHLSTHPCHHRHSHHPSLLHFFTPGSKPTFSN